MRVGVEMEEAVVAARGQHSFVVVQAARVAFVSMNNPTQPIHSKILQIHQAYIQPPL